MLLIRYILCILISKSLTGASLKQIDLLVFSPIIMCLGQFLFC